MRSSRLESCDGKPDICCSTMVKNFNERLRRCKVDISDPACLKDDKGQWPIIGIDRFNHAAFKNCGIRKEQWRLKSNHSDALLPFAMLADFRRPPYRRAWKFQ